MGEGGTRFSPIVVFTEQGTALTVEKILMHHRELEILVNKSAIVPDNFVKDHDMAEDLAVTKCYHSCSPGARCTPHPCASPCLAWECQRGWLGNERGTRVHC